jgi:hypothetical protein
MCGLGRSPHPGKACATCSCLGAEGRSNGVATHYYGLVVYSLYVLPTRPVGIKRPSTLVPDLSV